MRPTSTLTIGDGQPAPGRGRQLVLYVLLPGLPLLLFFLLWRVALANTGVVLQCSVSPRGTYTAELIRQDPGRDASYDYYVRLRRSSSRIVDPLLGNEYRAFDQGGSTGEVRLIWTGDSALTIRCIGCEGFRTGKESWSGVHLNYEIHPRLK